MYLPSPKSLLRAALFAGALLSIAAVPTARARDFHSAEERPLNDTAYTPVAHQVTLNAGIFGTQYANLLAILGISFAPFKFWEIGINLAHLGVGVLNVRTKFNFLDYKGYGIGLNVEFLWAHGDWLWVLPPYEKHLASGIDVFLVPVQLIGSADFGDWFHADLKVEYVDAEVIGHLSDGRLFYDGNLGARVVSIEPTLRFYLGSRVSLEGSTHLPMWGQVRHQVVADVDVTPGLRGGVRTAGYQNLRPLYTWSVTGAVKTEVITRLYLGFSLTVGPYTEKIYRRRLNTGLDLEWRF